MTIFLMSLFLVAPAAAAPGTDGALAQLGAATAAAHTPGVPGPGKPANTGYAAEEGLSAKGGLPLEDGLTSYAKAAGLRAGTKFEILQELFERGRPATKEELTGWFSGRYVCAEYPDLMWGSLMAGFEAAEAGPLFPSRFWMALPRPNRDLSYYDSLSAAKTDIIRATIDRARFQLTFPEAAGTYTYPGAPAPITYRLEYRRNGEYIVEKMGDSQPGAGYTYYFLKVTPKK
ncbi:MAG TPA: hypothetical protein PL037_07825 [Elusimicrobiales bacterium]|nr:hypothetical protein [Elusimicrobiales bacterium]